MATVIKVQTLRLVADVIRTLSPARAANPDSWAEWLYARAFRIEMDARFQ